MLSEELKRPLSWRETLLAFAGGFIAIGLSAYACFRTTGYNQYIGAFILWYAAGVILHESGHACMAVCAGGTINYVRLGVRLTNRAPWKIRFLNLDWFIYGLPFSGSVHSSLYTTDHYRTKRCLIIAGGPLVNVLLLVGAVVAINHVPANSGQQNLLMAGIIANGCLLSYSVIPRMVRSYGKLTPNDALNIWHTIHYTDQVVQTHVRHAERNRDAKAELAIAENLSIEDLLARVEIESPSIASLAVLVEKLHAANDERYPTCALRLTGRPELPKNQVAAVLDSCLTWQLHRGPAGDAAQADELSRRLLELEDTLSTRGTRGSVLVDLGRIDEGKALLLDVLAKTDNPMDKAYSNVFLALAEKRMGKFDMAQKYARAAERADANCPALKRVADLLAVDQRRS